MAHPKRIFAFNYTLKGTDGSILDASEENDPLAFLEGAGQIIPGLESALLFMQEGDKKTVHLKPEEAYGMPSEKMLMQVPVAELAHIPDLKVGSFLRLDLAEQTKVVRVSAMNAENITLDGNHPLAGQELIFEVEMVLIRDATPEELTHGHAHGLHGHAHH